MRLLLYGLVTGTLALTILCVAAAQSPDLPAAAETSYLDVLPPPPPVPRAPVPNDQQTKDVELLKKQIRDRQRTIDMLAERLRRQPPGPDVAGQSPATGVRTAPVVAAPPTHEFETTAIIETVRGDGTPQAEPTPLQRLEALGAQVKQADKQQAAVRADAADDQVKKQLDLLQKQIQTQQKMIDLLVQQLKKQPATAAAVAKLQTQAATLEARTQQAARRDDEVAHAIDDVREEGDAERRYGPELPAPLKELFLPSGTNETPLSIYGTLAFGYSKIIGDSTTAANGLGRPSTPAGFYFGEFTPDFLLKLNDWILLEAEIGIGSNGSVSAGSFAQADFFVNDWLTIIAGRFVAPIGFFNERLNNPWINKLPGDAPGSAPPLWMQVLPATSLLGVQAQGSFYLGCSPFKLEYNAYISNGLNLTPATPGAPTISELANLENMTDTFTLITNDKAVGGRLGLWWPEKGLEAGVSAMYNGDYVAGGFEESLSLWAVDFNYHKGNWDVRAEGGITYQQAQSFLGSHIRREGFYGQVAYRPWDARCKYLRNLEGVYRYSYVVFPGIDENELDLTTFATPIDVPLRRQQNEFGINYYFYPRMVLKVAYQINDEPKFHLHDNQFITELAWGW
ncbi:MAG TPA: hypothetical protein VG013_00460 [Gemmataceae bacterium]|nr:hypothetical protein [Gemmataceae bacterium]